MRRALLAVLLATVLAPSAQAQQSVAAANWRAMVGRSFPLRLDVVPVPAPAGGGSSGAALGGTNVFTGSNTFTDNLLFIVDNGDPTKRAQFEVATITTGQTRTYTLPDGNLTLAATNLSQTFGGTQTFGAMSIGANSSFTFSTDSALGLFTAQTPDTTVFGTGALANSFIIAERADATFDFAHALATDPTIFGHSHNQTTTEYWSLRHDATNAILGTGAGRVVFSPGNADILAVSSSTNALVVQSGTVFSWASTSTPGTSNGDTMLGREAAATVQMGQDVNGAAVDQTFKAHDGITGTDINGAKLTLSPGRGTGKASAGSLILNRSVGVTTGTTAQTLAPGHVICPAVRLSTTTGTTQTVATITTTSTTAGSVTLDYTVVANNGTLQDVDGGLIKVAWGNNAGTVTSTATAIAMQADADASGTLGATPTRTDATNVVSIKLAPAWVTIVPTSVLAYLNFTVASQGDTVVCVTQ